MTGSLREYGLIGLILLVLALGKAPAGDLPKDATPRPTPPATLADYLKPIPQHKGGPTGSGIMYVTDKIPPIEYPKFKGQYYSKLAPDTLDLAARAALGLHGMTACSDPAADYEIYGLGGIETGAPRLGHSYNDYNGGQAKYIEALPLLRTVSGSRENLAVDTEMMRTLFHMQGADGLYWIPIQGSPWVNRPEGEFDPRAKQIYNSWPVGRALLALSVWYETNQSAAFKQAIERMVDGLAKVAIQEGDGCYFLQRRFDDVYPDKTVPRGGAAACSQSTILIGLAYAYKSTHYEPARELAEKLTRFYLGPAKTIHADGRYMDGVHFHGMSLALLGVLELGLATDNRPLIELTRKAYEFARTQGMQVMGWFPEIYPGANYYVESCQVGEMTIWAAKLSAAGLGDYWEDVEYAVRNQLASNQVTDTGWLEQAARDNPVARDPDPALVRGPGVAERMLGTYACYCAPNGQMITSLMHCCTGNANRAWYFAWRHIVDEKDGALRVNLLLNRASQWADVDSYLPYQGRVEISMKKRENLSVRIPSWVKDGEVKCMVNGKARTCALNGRYLAVGRVKAGDKVRVDFPLKREIVKLQIVDRPYTVDVKGFNIVEIWPKFEAKPDSYHWPILFPYYTREDYRRDTPRLIPVTRFVPENEMNW